jgi:hypothetical protein
MDAGSLGGRQWKGASVNKLFSALLIIACCSAIGCGKKELGAVRGTVTFKGEKVHEGMLIFKNQDTGTSYTGQLDSEGNYTMVVPEGAGIPVGRYKVTVLPPFSASAADPKKYANIPQRYRDQKTSDLEIEVVAKGVEFNIDLKP